MKFKAILVVALLLIASVGWSAGGDLNLKLMQSNLKAETAQVAFDGIRAYRTGSGVYLKDFGRGDSDDSAKLYSGQMLDFDGVDDSIIVGDIGIDGNTIVFTIDPVTTTGMILQLASGTTVSILSGTLTTAGLSGVTAYVDGSVGTTVTADYHRIVLTFTAKDCDSVTIGSDGSNYFDGLIGNVQVWDATFNADDVKYDYNYCFLGDVTAADRPDTSFTSANLKGHWPLIAGSGDCAYDWSGNGNHGTLTNFPTDDSQWSNADALDSPLVIQTALCEWGMGSNVLPYSDEFELYWNVQGGSVSSGGTRLDGRTAILFTEDNATSQHRQRLVSHTGFLTGTNAIRMKIKKAGIRDTFDAQLYNSTDGIIARTRLTFSTGLLSSIIGTASVESLDDDWFLLSISGTSTVDGSGLYVGDNNADTGIDGPAYWIDGVQGINGSISDINASCITHADNATNALVPIRSWETAGQFKRDYSELNFNGRSFIEKLTGTDVTTSGTYTLETVLNIDNVTALQYILDGQHNTGTGYVRQTAGTLTVSSGTVYVDGVATTTITAGLCHVVVSGITLTVDELWLINTFANDNKLTGQLAMLKLYAETWDAAKVTKYFNKAKAKYGL